MLPYKPALLPVAVQGPALVFDDIRCMQVLMQLADKRNSKPLPKFKNRYEPVQPCLPLRRALNRTCTLLRQCQKSPQMPGNRS